MNTSDAFLADIREHPEDVGLRRIYADWLEDHGELARAEFIRVQLDLAAMDDWDDRRPALEKRESELLASYRDQWLEGLPAGAATFRGGLPQEWFLSGEALLNEGPAIFAQCPVVRLGLFDLGQASWGEQVAACPLLDQVAKLDLGSSNLSAWNWIKLLQLHSLPRLQVLDLSRLQIGQSGLDTLLRHPCSLSLRSLDLETNELFGNAIESLAQCPNLGQLEDLNLADNRLGSLEMSFLAGARHLPKLRSLSLAGNRLGTGGLRELAQAPFLENLHELNLGHNGIGGNLVDLLRPGRLPQLQHLDLAGNRLAAADFRALVAAPFFAQLRKLDLYLNPLCMGDLEIVTHARPVPHLETLELQECSLTNEAVRPLVNWPGLQSMHSINLSFNQLTAHGLRPLLFTQPLVRLRALWLGGNPLGDLGAQMLARWPGIKHVHTLDLWSCQISEVGGRALLEAIEYLPNLNLAGNPLPADLVAAFGAAQDAGRIGVLRISEADEA
jgi:uncharacterized protein (TIGR02996 family)